MSDSDTEKGGAVLWTDGRQAWRLMKEDRNKGMSFYPATPADLAAAGFVPKAELQAVKDQSDEWQRTAQARIAELEYALESIAGKNDNEVFDVKLCALRVLEGAANPPPALASQPVQGEAKPYMLHCAKCGADGKTNMLSCGPCTGGMIAEETAQLEAKLRALEAEREALVAVERSTRNYIAGTAGESPVWGALTKLDRLRTEQAAGKEDSSPSCVPEVVSPGLDATDGAGPSGV